MKAALVKGAIALQKEIVKFIDDDTKMVNQSIPYCKCTAFMTKSNLL